MDISAEKRRHGFGFWLRTGQWPRLGDDSEFEVKFNPWHDPEDGRFTFSNTGRYYGAGDAGPSDSVGQHVPKISYSKDARLPSISTREEIEAWKAEQLAKHGHKPGYRTAIEARYRIYLSKLPRSEDGSIVATTAPRRSENRIGPIAKQRSRLSDQIGFRGGGDSFKGRGSSGSAGDSRVRRTSRASPERQNTRSREGDGFARGDGGGFGGGGATGSWDWPASRPGRPVPTPPAKPAARPGGSAVASRAVTAAIFASRTGRAGTIAAAKRAPNIRWVDENIGFKGIAKDYNDAATGARSNVVTKHSQVPAVERRLPDGRVRLVKFDGIDGEHLIDRKWSIYMTDKAKKQALRQSEALKQNGLTAFWQVPTEIQKRRALKLLKGLDISNIRVEVVKP